MGTLGVGKDEKRDMLSIRYKKNEGVRVFGFNGEGGGERKSGHANGMMVKGKYDMVMKGVGNEWRVTGIEIK